MESYKTFLYAVRDSPALRVKYGYVTCPDAKAARKHLHSRYRTYYYSCELLHVVPVAQRGVDAEAQLKASLMPHHIGREFLMFADEDCLQAELRRAFEEATCDEEVAARRQSRRGATKGERKRVREEAELLAAVEVALIAKRRRLEHREQARQRRQELARQRTPKSVNNVPKQLRAAVDHGGVMTWARQHVKCLPGKLMTLKDAHLHYTDLGGKLGKSKFGASLKSFMVTQGKALTLQSTRENRKANNFWDGVSLSI